MQVDRTCHSHIPASGCHPIGQPICVAHQRSRLGSKLESKPSFGYEQGHRKVNVMVRASLSALAVVLVAVAAASCTSGTSKSASSTPTSDTCLLYTSDAAD